MGWLSRACCVRYESETDLLQVACCLLRVPDPTFPASPRRTWMLDPCMGGCVAVGFRGAGCAVGKVQGSFGRLTGQSLLRHDDPPRCCSSIPALPSPSSYCALEHQCPNIHVLPEGYHGRRSWLRYPATYSDPTLPSLSALPDLSMGRPCTCIALPPTPTPHPSPYTAQWGLTRLAVLVALLPARWELM